MGLVGAPTCAAIPAWEPFPLAWLLAGGADAAAILASGRAPGRRLPPRAGLAEEGGAGEASPGGGGEAGGDNWVETRRRRRRRTGRRQGPDWNLGVWPGAGPYLYVGIVAGVHLGKGPNGTGTLADRQVWLFEHRLLTVLVCWMKASPLTSIWHMVSRVYVSILFFHHNWGIYSSFLFIYTYTSHIYANE
jgi:hypothetical protein